MTTSVFSGVIPALMTPCGADLQPRFDLLVRTAKDLMGKGMSAVVYCGSMGDWPLLTDEQRMAGVEALIAAGIPVIVGTGAQNSARAAALAAHARRSGAAGLMIIPRVLSRGPSAAAQRAHFEAILKAGDGLPSVIYNSPYYGYETRAELFFALRAAYPHLIGFKEFGGAASLRYAAEHITSQDPDVRLMVGVDTQVVHGYVNCGATGAITGIGNVLPAEVLHLVALCERAARGDAAARRDATELEAALGVLSSFDEGADLVLFYKYLMQLEGHEGYDRHFIATDALSPSQKGFAAAQLAQFKAWYRDWSGQRRAA
jgi:4-hydroxy-tetrahydrodipicolinate synthase